MRADAAPMEEVCEAIRHGSLMGARGNSGVILSQILRGLADTFSPLDAVSGADVAAGLRRADRRRLPGGAPPGRGHHPHRRAHRPPSRSSGR